MNWGLLIVLILGGLALFLHGMSVMTEGLKAAAGTRMKSFLQGMTKNRWTSLLAGTGITAVIQSSSITTVLAVGFVSAGLLSFQSTLGLILGANLGTTITAQIIAFKITKASWVMVATGYLISVVFSKKSIREIGNIILGLGMVFLGMNVMGQATEPLKTYEPFIGLMKGLDNHLLGILIGTVFTAAIQSSSATTGVVIVLASQGLISTDGGIAIILGANIGTCVTALLSALGKPREAVRVAISHVFFKVIGVLAWFAFINDLSDFVHWISSEDEARQIANAHTLFNLGNTLVFIWLVYPISKLVILLIPDDKKEKEKLFPELHSFYLENSLMALDISNNAILKLGDYTMSIIEKGIDVATRGDSEQLTRLRQEDSIIDKGHTELLVFLQQIQSNKLSKKESKLLERQIEAVNILESAADIITTDLVEAAEHRIQIKFKPSEETYQKLAQLYHVALEFFSISLANFNKKEKSVSPEKSKSDFKEELIKVRAHLISRLSETDNKRIAIYRFESEVLESTRRLHALARRLNRRAK